MSTATSRPGAVVNPFTGTSIPRLIRPEHRPPAKRHAEAALRSSIPLYDLLAHDYDAHFAVPHRRAYDDLAWEMVSDRLPMEPGTIVDAGCGSGRWAQPLTELGHRVIGIEQAPAMAAAAQVRMAASGDRFTLVRSSMETADLSAELPPGGADLVLAMGSMQYTSEPGKTLRRLAGWAKPGGYVMVLVDSLVALVQELLSAGATAEAVERMETRQGIWVQEGLQADMHLLDAMRLRVDAAHAGLQNVSVHGLLVSWSTLGRAEMLTRLDAAWDEQLAVERRLAKDPWMADLGKQLIMIGKVPA